MSLDPLARLKSLLRARIRKLIAQERARALEAETRAIKEGRLNETSKQTA